MSCQLIENVFFFIERGIKSLRSTCPSLARELHANMNNDRIDSFQRLLFGFVCIEKLILSIWDKNAVCQKFKNFDW